MQVSAGVSQTRKGAALAMDWFRRTTWTELDASEFEARLKRARANGRPQYVFIQGSTLFDTADIRLVRVALTLAERCATDFPKHIHRSAAFYLKGKCLERLDDLPGALAAYRLAVEAEREGGCVITDAYLSFAWVVAIREVRTHQVEARALLDEFAKRPAFPVQRFRHHAARALILAQTETGTGFATDARAALSAATADRSGFVWHQDLGLVGDRYEDVRSRLQSLIDGDEGSVAG